MLWCTFLKSSRSVDFKNGADFDFWFIFGGDMLTWRMGLQKLAGKGKSSFCADDRPETTPKCVKMPSYEFFSPREAFTIPNRSIIIILGQICKFCKNWVGCATQIWPVAKSNVLVQSPLMQKVGRFFAFWRCANARPLQKCPPISDNEHKTGRMSAFTF